MRRALHLVAGVICLVLALDVLVLVVRGIQLTWHAYVDLFTGAEGSHPLLPALEAIDLFFIALALLIVAIGLMQLFLVDVPFLRDARFAWLRIESFAQLKILLWDTFLVTLFVLFVTRLFAGDLLDWRLLVLPAAILILTVCSYLLKARH